MMITTDRQIKQLEIKGARYQVKTDVVGLSVLVRPGGAKTFAYRGKRLARTSEITLAQARLICLEKMKQGGEMLTPPKPSPKPGAARKKRAAKPPATPATDQLIEQLFGNLIFSWLASTRFDDCPNKDRVARKRADSMVRNSLLVDLGPLPVTRITEDILEKTFISLVRQGKRDAAGRCRRILEAFFSHLVERQIIKRSPTAVLKPMVFTGKNAMNV